MFRFNAMRLYFLLISFASINGCGFSHFSHRETNPVVKDSTNNASFWGKLLDETSFSTFSTTASRRIVVVLQDQKSKKTEICSEPSPDVGEAFASAVADAIGVKVPIKGVPIDVSNQYARAVSTQIASLIYRTQGLQLYRDAMHNLCVDKMNKWITAIGEQSPGSYENLRKHYFDESVNLIKAELANIKDVGSVKAGENPSFDKVSKFAIEFATATKSPPVPNSEASPP